jgi:hypothetical protein
MKIIGQLLVALTLCALWQLAFAEETWVEGESVSVEAKNCQGQDFVLLESGAGYLDLPGEEVFPAVGGSSTLAVVVNVGHPCLQDSTKDNVPVSLELTLPPGIELTELTPTCYFAATETEKLQDVSADANFSCTATLTPTYKLDLGSRDLPGGSNFLIHLPISFTGEIPESASYKTGTVRFALQTPTRTANVVMRIPVADTPLIRYLEPSVRFLGELMVMDALIDTKGQAGQVFFEYARSDAPETFDSLAPLDLAATQGYMQVHALFTDYVPSSYLWRVRFVSEVGKSYLGQEQSFTTPKTSAVKP